MSSSEMMKSQQTDQITYGFDDLRGRRVLVTGASSGIGAAVAQAFGAAGALVGIQYRHGEAEARSVEEAIVRLGGEAWILQADLTDPLSCSQLVDRAVENLGGVDVLINNAGGLIERRPFAETDDALACAVFDLNLRAVVNLVRAAIPTLRASGSGTVINTSSVAARNGGGAGSVLYAAAKGGINALSLGLAKELGPLGIRVNVISPGVVVSPFHDGHTTAEALEAVRRLTPLGRLGMVEDCVGAFLFLASPTLSGYISGANIEITGGRV